MIPPHRGMGALNFTKAFSAMKLELLETFITGHPLIDAEHVKIITAINDVSAAVEAAEYEKCACLLDDFLTTCQDHFHAEERLLADLKYPYLRDHTAFHKELILKAKSVKALCMNARAPESIQKCFEEMASLLIEDVIKGDLQFVSFFIDQGILPPRK